MKDSLLTCPICGNRFDPIANAACQSCPLHRGCQLTCCPACGFETVNPQQSTLAKLAGRLFSLGTPTGGSKGPFDPTAGTNL